MIRCLIIDDEPKAIELLKLYSDRHRDIEVCQSFRDPVSSIAYLENNEVDVIFLDINMPKISGISLAKIIGKNTLIIFTTAYSEYAVESYDIGAIDYLLKPISFDRFYKSIQKLQDYLSSKSLNCDWLLVKSGNSTHRLHPDDISYLEKDGNYCFYHTSEKRIMARESTAEALSKLPDYFIRVHKSFIVNINQVRQFNQNTIVIGSDHIPIGESFKKQTFEALTGLSH